MDASALVGPQFGALDSCFDSAYPWIRLDYTFSWAEGGDDYDLTEFIFLPGSTVDAFWTVEKDEFVDSLTP